jgi:hypothetical protein
MNFISLLKFDTWQTTLLVWARRGYGAYSKFNNEDAEGVFGVGIVYGKLWTLRSLPGSIINGLLWGGGGFWRRTCAKITHKHIHYKNWNKIHSRVFQTSKVRKKCDCAHRWTRWSFQTRYITPLFVFRFQCNLFFDKTYPECVAWLFDHPILFYDKCYGHQQNPNPVQTWRESLILWNRYMYWNL